MSDKLYSWIVIGLMAGVGVGCRSQQAAFSFRAQTQLSAALYPAQALPAASPVQGHLPFSARFQPAFRLAGRHKASAAAGRIATPSRQILQAASPRHLLPVNNPQRLHSTVSPSLKGPAHTTSPKGDLLQVLATLLFIGGIVLGIIMGGWAGFGLFVLCSLAALVLAFWGGFIIDGNLP
ncbi:hypothetical protein PK28_00685 [Hymenobacter sp. DG25B]|uniref:hypothetical protein n=1 Tax=Hymenobacter sp. DG25B TaxID=1385664 RepID=UPI00054127B6|nr:hypothetical protein [Hymenobacter sp. DG25B]AIZ62571.1 hypothetical protein PK28_00685 [Hymenobacter sp. DG25B]